MLGKFWNIGPGDAKFDAGEMLQNGEQYLVETKLSYAREEFSGQGLCDFRSEGFDYDDMVAVADYWQVSVGQAKTSINNKLEWGFQQAAHDVVQDARQFVSAYRTERIALQSLNRDGNTLGYFVRNSDGSWVEQSVSGENLFFFREVDHNPLVTTLLDDSRGVEIQLDHHFSQVRYKLASDSGAPQALYAMSF